MKNNLSFEKACWLAVKEAVEKVGVKSMLKTTWFSPSWVSNSKKVDK
jgi:hypothetical protein